MIVIADFAENYSFILQDAAQGFHWSNDQVTLYPFVCYYRKGTELEHINLVISDCLKYDTVAVHLFQRNLVKMLKNKINFDIKKLIHFPMVLHHIRIMKTLSICATTKLTLE